MSGRKRERAGLTGAMATAALAALLAGTAPALADVKAGVDAWSHGDYAAAIKEWQPLAARGDADAQFNMAQAYKLGRGVPQDLAIAEALYGKAAAQGHVQAADNYGLLLFQRGEHGQALPYIKAGAEHGDPRAEYLYGIALFNGDGVTKDWVRAYAFVSLAQQQGLPQAQPALAQMDQYIPLEQRQKAVSVAGEISAQAEASRQRQFAAMDLGTRLPAAGGKAAKAPPAAPVAAATAAAAARPAPVAPAPAPAPAPRTAPAIASPPAAAAVAPPAPKPAPRPAPPHPAASADDAGGSWKIQLGAFAVAANADGLWARLHGRPELAGHPRINARSGAVTRLLAGGYSASGARAACGKLSTAGFTCIAVAN